jgi:hypothetical protein
VPQEGILAKMARIESLAAKITRDSHIPQPRPRRVPFTPEDQTCQNRGSRQILAESNLFHQSVKVLKQIFGGETTGRVAGADGARPHPAPKMVMAPQSF